MKKNHTIRDLVIVDNAVNKIKSSLFTGMIESGDTLNEKLVVLDKSKVDPNWILCIHIEVYKQTRIQTEGHAARNAR